MDEVGNKPQKGEVLSWAESSAVVYANSVLGARCNRNSGIIDIMGSIVGYVPYFGLLTDEGRKATWVIVQNSQMLQNDFFQVYGVNQVDIINQLIDSIKVNVTADTSTMEIQLTPESLGKLNLTVVAKDGNITASITAQNDTVKAIIESQLIQLKEALNNQGLKVADVEKLLHKLGY